jgi:hypothetical protein
MHAFATEDPNPLQQLRIQGQSVWLDDIRASLISSGTLERMIREDALTGLTSNPSIFQKAITGSADYRDTLQSQRNHAELDAAAVFERLAIEDTRRAADHFAPVYHATRRRDGYVSLEVSPCGCCCTSQHQSTRHRARLLGYFRDMGGQIRQSLSGGILWLVKPAQATGDEIPVDHLPETLNIVGAGIAVVDIIRVLPHIAGQQR